MATPPGVPVAATHPDEPVEYLTVPEDAMRDPQASNRMIENLEDRRMFSITTTTEVVKVPGPTDVVLVVGTNPAGHTPPGQGDTLVLSNRDARHL